MFSRFVITLTQKLLHVVSNLLCSLTSTSRAPTMRRERFVTLISEHRLGGVS